MNLAAICLALFLPWVLFCIMYAVMSFSMHYNEKGLCYLSVFLGLVFTITIAKIALDSVNRERGDANSDPSWLVFLAVVCFIAWLSGVLLGDLNYFYNMEPFYEINTLNVYSPVDPTKTAGQMVMDAGRVTFSKGTKPDPQKGMAFKNLDTYCVAPIVNEKSRNESEITKRASYDFWAVGLNCCSGPYDFACGEYNNPHASSGLRVMRDDQREFYQLAVRQAEAAYGIHAKHPMFLYWMQDPIAEISAYMDEGFKYYLFGVFAFFAFLLFLIIVAAVLFSKLS